MSFFINISSFNLELFLLFFDWIELLKTRNTLLICAKFGK